MVFQKRLDYGFNGYQVPRGCRSARGRSSLKRKIEDTQMGAFELLATVAGKLLQEREASPAHSNVSGGIGTTMQATVGKDNVKLEQRDEEKPLKVESCDQGSSEETSLVSKPNQNKSLDEFSHVVSDPASLMVNCGKSVNAEERNEIVPETCIFNDMLELDTKPPALVSSDSSIGIHPSSGPFPGCRGNVKLVSRDDDDNSSGCTQPSTTPLKSSRTPPRLEDRKIKKVLESKYWEVAPKLEGELSNTAHLPQRESLLYTAKISKEYFEEEEARKRAVSTSDGGVSSEVISNSSKNGKNGKTNSLFSTTHGGSGVSSSSAAGHESSSQSKDAHVKLSIKSFRVPELFIEIPETATVGSLKRSVMEAVAAIIGEGLHVGVLYQGKKIRDDSKTLLQTGICDDDKLDGLGFALEPNPTNGSHFSPKDPPYLVQSDVPQLLTRYPLSPGIDAGLSDASPDTPLTNLTNCVESDHDSVLSPTDMSIDKTMPDSRALVPYPSMSVDALAVVPLHRKSRRSDLVQRRIRRPFSVHEVEALVHAVEKLGTGRWRDVKLRAFDNAKHRTYVDLKDKWKTLVHTARISPQQRRGEPVPQELLDRVLAAHAYWSQQQAKQQVKQLTETCLLLKT